MKNAIGQLSEVLYVPDFDGEKVRQKNIGSSGTIRATRPRYIPLDATGVLVLSHLRKFSLLFGVCRSPNEVIATV
jgi:hypothetical protein